MDMNGRFFKFIRMLDPSRVILGDKRMLGTQCYDNFLDQLKQDFEEKADANAGFRKGEHVLVNSGKLAGVRRALVLNTANQGCYSVYLYDEGEFEDIDASQVAPLSKQRILQLDPLTVIVRLLGIAPVSGNMTQDSSWSTTTIQMVQEWLQHPDIIYFRVQYANEKMTLDDGSSYGDILREIQISAVGASESNTPYEESLTQYIIYEILGRFDRQLAVTQLNLLHCPSSGSNNGSSSNGASSTTPTISTAISNAEVGLPNRNLDSDIPGHLLVRGRMVEPPYTNIEDLSLAKPILYALSVLGIEPSQMTKIVASNFMHGSDIFVIAPEVTVSSQKQSRALSYVIPILSLVYDKYKNMTSVDADEPPETLIIVNSHNTGTSLEQYILENLLGHCQNLPLRVKFLFRDTVPRSTNYNKNAIPGGQGILIMTMAHLEAVMQTKDGPFLFKRLRFLIFDELDLYVKTHMESILTFINAAQANLYVSSKSLPFQIVFSGSKWSVEMQNLLLEVLQCRAPILVIKSCPQVLRYAEIEWKVHFVPQEDARKQKLIDLLNSHNFKKENQNLIVISCSTPEVATSIHELVSLDTAFQTHLITCDRDGDSVSERMLAEKNCRNVLIISDNMVRKAPVSNATCLINFDSPQNTSGRSILTTERFAFVWSNIRNVQVENALYSADQAAMGQTLTTHFFMTGLEHNFYQLYKFTNSLENTVVADFPVELKQRAESTERENFQHVPLCNGVRLFGFCDHFDSQDCPARHGFKREELEDTFGLPLSGELEVRIMSCKNPSLYQVQLRRHYEYDQKEKRVMKCSYLEEANRRKSELMKYYNDRKGNSNVEVEDDLSLQCFKEGTWCGVEVERFDEGEDYFARAKVQCVLQWDKFGSPTILRVLCVDSGQSVSPSVKQLYKLPKEFQEWHPLVVDLVLCDLKPRRDEKKYRIYDIRRADKLTTEKILTAKIWLAIGNTVWVNPMVEYRTHSDTKEIYKVASTRLVLISEQLAEGNGNHLKSLMELVNKHPGVYRGLTSFSNDETWHSFGLIKKDFHQPGDEIQWAFVPKSCDNTIQQTRIVTQYGYDPWLFFGVHANFYKQLKSLEEDLNNCIEKYISERFANGRDMLRKHYKPGMAVAVKDRNIKTWIRGLIQAKYDGDDENEDEFEVYFVDFGDTCGNMTADELFPLPKSMVTRLPFQAIAFKIKHITNNKPVEECDDVFWNRAAKDAFLDIIAFEGLSVYVDVVAFSDEEDTFSEFPLPCRFYNAVVFYKGEDLGMTLVQKGLAAWTPGMETLVQETKDKLEKQENEKDDDLDDRLNAINLEDFDVNYDENNADFGFKLNKGVNIEDSYFSVVENDPQSRDVINPFFKPTKKPQLALPAPTPSVSSAQVPRPCSSLALRTDLLYPRVVWRQTDFSLVLTVQLTDIKEYELELLDDKITIQFRTLDKTPNYEFTMKVYGKLQPDFSTHLTGQHLRITFPKRLANKTWPRVLFHRDRKYLWLKEDLDYVYDPKEHVTEWETLRNRHKEQSLASTSAIPTNGNDKDESDYSDDNGVDDNLEMLLENVSNDED